MANHYKLSPSDLTFLWDECPRCFYLKVVHGFGRPFSPFPSIFNKIDKLMKEHFNGHPAEEVSPELPKGRIEAGERWVESQPIVIPGIGASAYIRGKFDAVIAFDSGSYAVIDFKTSETRAEHVAFYGRQLHAYAYALENPGLNKLQLAPVTHLGLLSVAPAAMEIDEQEMVSYIGKITWQPIPKDEVGFLRFMEQVLSVLACENPPEPNPKCGYCEYRQASRENGW